jgi:hypothetical protein
MLARLTMGAAATLDITDNALVIDYQGESPIAVIRERILAGRSAAGIGSGTWRGTGITSSVAAEINSTDGESRSVGYAENAALPLGQYAVFRGQAVDDTAILIAYVRTSDANLDGVVNDDDATIVGATFEPVRSSANWALGDFDFNGFIDDDDVTLLGVFYESAANPPGRASDELIDQLAESLRLTIGTESVDLMHDARIVGRRSYTIDGFWSTWNW